MSASREKRARKDGVNPDLILQQENELKEKKAKTKKNVLIGIAITLVVCLLIGSIVLFRGPYFVKNSVAVTTGSHELSPVQVRYFYMDAYNELNQTYGSMFSMMFPEGGDISEQVYDSTTGQTWGEVLMDGALEQIRGVYAIYDEAVANGFELPEEGEQNLNTTSAMMELYAEYSGMTADGYLRQVYGSGSDLESYMEYQRILNVASYYQLEVQDSFTYSEDELNEAYEADPASYDLFTYHSYLIQPETEEETEETEDAEETDNSAAMAEVKAIAEDMAAEAEGDIDRYLELCDENSGSDIYTTTQSSLRSNTNAASLPDEVYDWMTDPARQEGDTAAIEFTDVGYYVLYYVSRTDNDYDAMNIRSIKLSAETTDDEGNTTINWDLVDAELGFFNTEMMSYEDKAEAFDNLASLYSDDENTSSTGGVYEVVYKGQFNEEVDAWIFSEDREIGDYEVVKTEDAYYVLYLESSAGNYRDYLVDQDLRSTDFNEWLDTLTADATVERNESGMERVDTAITLTVSQ